MAIKLALLGEGISRSRMPKLQEYLGALTGIDVSYGLLDGEVTGQDPVAAVIDARSRGYQGLNVTHPYKQKIIDLVDDFLRPDDPNIGSFNTLKFVDSKLLAANTDYSGFIRGYRYRRGDAHPGRILLCGAGGVGRAIAHGLSTLAAEHIDIFDPVAAQSESLCSDLRGRGVSARAISIEEIPIAAAAAKGLVNCTALGMVNHPGSAFPASLIGGQEWAFDAVYTPLQTEFLQHCTAAGLTIVSGFDLWIFQGLDAFFLYTGVNVDADETLIGTALNWLD